MRSSARPAPSNGPDSLHIASPAGATVQCDRYGNGPPLVLVHGGFSDHISNWEYVAPALSAHFTIHAVARRGRGERRRPQIGWASLTPVERDLVRLLAEGHTNAEIGRRLFISVNTVKKYLSRVYAKVDVDGRADLAAEVARRDL
jgi:DNA-binding CsgD family transcriptional regulator